MNSDSFREYSTRLTLLYSRYLDSVRAAFLPAAPRAARIRSEPAEHRWEGEGGKPK
jgi:hypothetical protein